MLDVDNFFDVIRTYQAAVPFRKVYMLGKINCLLGKINFMFKMWLKFL